ncbi:hypothetical protein RMCBS344292_16603 [Rhizopus microsporus]|nr:hypothetical protein RMCBS344292_16603 [Rhizopus microsporus]
MFIASPPGPPLVCRPNWLLRSSFWRLFWSLPLPPQASTPWWRLLHGHVSTQAFWHRLTPSVVSSPLCRFCGDAPEDIYHFVIGCRLKSTYWREMLQFLLLDDEFTRDLQVWSALFCFCGLYGNRLRKEVLTILGVAFTTLWKYHWQCVFDNAPWSPRSCFWLFQTEQSYYISSFMSSLS